MSEKNRMEKLVERLIEKTRKGEVAWAESVPSGTFLTSFPNYSVKIEPPSTVLQAIGLDSHRYVVKVLGQNGEIIAKTASSLMERLENTELIVPSESMELLYSSAKSSLRREDDLDKLLQEIG